jgi:hypothetical protein
MPQCATSFQAHLLARHVNHDFLVELLLEVLNLGHRLVGLGEIVGHRAGGVLLVVLESKQGLVEGLVVNFTTEDSPAKSLTKLVSSYFHVNSPKNRRGKRSSCLPPLSNRVLPRFHSVETENSV